MRNGLSLGNTFNGLDGFSLNTSIASRQIFIGIILILALFAFEMFNFDTTRYALGTLLGDIRFAGLTWATILAVAFCAIDFAGLARLFTPERGLDEPKEIWYLTGAWLLGATMNAVMTWWAVSSVLITHEFGNEVLSREQLLKIVPIFVAVLVWLTRILFIGAVTMAGERLLHGSNAKHRDRNTSSLGKDAMSTSRGQTVGAKVQPAPQTASSAPSMSNPPRSKSGRHVDKSRVLRRPPRPVINGQSSPKYQGASSATRRR